MKLYVMAPTAEKLRGWKFFEFFLNPKKGVKSQKMALEAKEKMVKFSI